MPKKKNLGNFHHKDACPNINSEIFSAESSLGKIFRFICPFFTLLEVKITLKYTSSSHFDTNIDLR